MIDSAVSGNALLMREVGGKWPAEKHLCMHKTSNLAVDELQQQKTWSLSSL